MSHLVRFLACPPQNTSKLVKNEVSLQQIKQITHILKHIIHIAAYAVMLVLISLSN
ncbi:MAG: hypothetical protein ACI8SJ_001636 [Shewanella sp.]|jgi:hypothetical protein